MKKPPSPKSFHSRTASTFDNQRKQMKQAQNGHPRSGSQDRDEDGVYLEYFTQNSSILIGVLPELRIRILQALGVDVLNPKAKVSWQVFLELYCIFEAGKLEPDQLYRFWVKFFD
jgi:hypothetical protein